jgi:hypothetical protein
MHSLRIIIITSMNCPVFLFYLGSQFCPYLLETVGLRAPDQFMRNSFCSRSALQVKRSPSIKENTVAPNGNRISAYQAVVRRYTD